MQEAVDTHKAGATRTGSEAGQPQEQAPTVASGYSSTPPSASITPPDGDAASPRTPSLLERLSPAPLDLQELTCGCRSPRQLKRWLAGYLQQNPPADRAQRNAGTLRSLLTEVTRWDNPARQRLASLEALRPVVVAHYQQLVHPLLNQARENPDTAQTQEQRRDLLTGIILLQHLALAYTSVCVQLAEAASTGKQNMLTRRRLAIALHRAIDGLRRLMFTSNVFFLASPKGSWGRLQRLLQLAREQQLEQRRIADPLAGPLAGGYRWDRLVRSYLDIALFASANPMQLTTGEQLQLWQCCRRWAASASLLDAPASGTPALLASLKLDQPPIPAVRLQQSRVGMHHFTIPQGWSVDLTGPLQQLQRRLRRPGALSPDVLQWVQAVWAGEKSRGGQRTPVNIRCQVAIGLSAVCHHLKCGDEAAPEIEATFAHATEADRALVMDVDTVDFRSGRTLRSYEVSAADPTGDLLPSAPSVARNAKPTTTRQRYQPIPATLLNTSEGGAGLRLPPATQIRPRCGDLIALWLNDRWQVALIRWQYALPDQCRLGIEFFGGHSSAVQVRRHTQDGRRTAPMAGLLTGDAGLPPELVLPIPLFQSGDTVDIVNAGQTRTVVLRSPTLTTGSLAIFEFS
ncbi:hypothetical protein JF535_03635 [Microbulbifer salipaludis]|uniref:GTPase n=1 Tax=Microbulbifer salipaludis TaxID=187980 RepID=A0ABS3E3Q0_9GAMM|nr:hypothetical protein [Microbulbifer salipaludis]MBN8429938.1 hypothetical protein [Microbulbifer salipaludis]